MPLLEQADSARIAELERQSQAQSARIDELVRQNHALDERSQGQSAVLEQLRSEITQLEVRQRRVEALASRPPAPAPAPAPATPPVPHLASTILDDFPGIFSEFRTKRFDLLWRGTRDGFNSADFHRRCDGRGPTLTVIRDTKGFIFGGFTPVAWDSGGRYRADPSFRSFVFTVKNPWGVGPRKFSLKKPEYAIVCRGLYGPVFGSGNDLLVANNGDVNSGSHTYLGGSYVNDTGRDRGKFFTGAQSFRVSEVEVFQVTG
jgi:hypothetical protein